MNVKKANKGFSFIELIIVVAILSIVMLAISQFMSSTVVTYTRTNSDNKVQKSAQETYDKISNHIMQAMCVDVLLSDGKEYSKNWDEKGVITADVYADSLDGYKLKYKSNTGTVNNLVSSNGGSLYSYDAFKSGKDILYKDANYIYIVYPGATNYYIAEYCFDKTNKKLYLKTKDTGLVIANTPVLTAPSNNIGLFTPTAQMKVDKYLLCSGVESFQVAADSSGNAIGVNITFEKRNMTYESKGMIKIRNGYVLKAKEK